MSAHDPATTQSARRAIKIGFAKREPSQDSFCFRFELPAAVLIKNLERIMIGNIVQSLPGLVLLDHFLRVHKLGRNGQSKFEHGLVSGGSGFLRKKSDGSILLDCDRSVIGRSLTEDK